MEDKFLFLVFYIEIAIITGFIILKKVQLIDSKSFLARIFYQLCWFTLIVATFILFQQFFAPNLLEENRFIAAAAGILLFITFLLGALGFVFVGLISIIKRETFAPGAVAVKGPVAVYWGIKYLLGGLAFLSLVLTIFFLIICSEFDKLCSIQLIPENIFSYIGNILVLFQEKLIIDQVLYLVIVAAFSLGAFYQFYIKSKRQQNRKK